MNQGREKSLLRGCGMVQGAVSLKHTVFCMMMWLVDDKLNSNVPYVKMKPDKVSKTIWFGPEKV